MPLATKYRPPSLEYMHGNGKTVASVQAIFQRPQPDWPHAFLLVGESGCGKTTLGRIILTLAGVQGLDMTENNAADFRGIDSVRDIIRKTAFKPVSGDASGWLLDECHQMSKDAQNALLKALEEAPKHVFFVLCTTEPEKLLPTIRNRCQTFEMLPLSDVEMSGLVASIAQAESVDLPAEVVDSVVATALGSPRAALTILDGIIGLPIEQMMEAVQVAAVSTAESIEICRALIDRKPWPVIAGLLQNCQQDAEAVRRAVLGYAQVVLLKSGKPQAYLVLECFSRPFYDGGKPLLVKACFEATTAKM